MDAPDLAGQFAQRDRDLLGQDQAGPVGGVGCVSFGVGSRDLQING